MEVDAESLEQAQEVLRALERARGKLRRRVNKVMDAIADEELGSKVGVVGGGGSWSPGGIDSDDIEEALGRR